MNLLFKKNIASGYKSASQKARILTEKWVHDSVFCPNCGQIDIQQYENNKPVADFYCQNCHEDYELKSKNNNIGSKIVDGAYRTMLQRLNSSNNPNFFLLHYDILNLQVINFLVIPKHFFIPAIIEKRKPLALTAKRAGWVGCNIILKNIPNSGKIFFVRDRKIENKNQVINNWQRTLFLREETEMKAKGWLLDVMNCIDSLNKIEFRLDEVYAFENALSKLHPDNKHIKDKIRQQLQLLRDKNYLNFKSRGYYSIK